MRPPARQHASRVGVGGFCVPFEVALDRSVDVAAAVVVAVGGWVIVRVGVEPSIALATVGGERRVAGIGTVV